MKHRWFRKLVPAKEGTSAIEFGIVALPLLMLALGVFEFTRLYWTQEALQESAAAGARCIGILQSSCASSGAYSPGNAANYIEQVAASWGVTLPGTDITMTNSATCGGTSGFSQVQITYIFKTLVPDIVPISPQGESLTVQSCYPNNP